MSRTVLVALTLFCLIAVPTASARHRGENARNRASFQVEAVREVENDWATARLTIQAEGKQAAAVAAEVNEAMARALARANREEAVETSSGGYQTHPIHDDGRVVRWRASQTLRLESGDVDRLAELIGALQGESVTLVGIQFSLRRETRAGLEDTLIKEALAAFRARADLVAEGMGAKTWSLVDVSIGTTGGQPYPMRMEARAASSRLGSAPPPAFEAGTSEVRVQASGVVELD